MPAAETPELVESGQVVGGVPAAAVATDLPEDGIHEFGLTPTGRVSVVARESAPSSPTGLAVLHGRCVDPNGQPLAGCRAVVRGWRVRRGGDNPEQPEASHPWQDPEPALSDGEGRFAISFAPPPDRLYTMDVTGPERVTMSGRWQSLLPGSVTNVGDVVLSSGTVVRGRIVDTLGRRQSKVRLTISGRDGIASIGQFARRNQAEISCGDDGVFVLPLVFPSGDYIVSVSGRELLSPLTFTLHPGEPIMDLEVLVQGRSSDEVISGRVLDEHGKPVANVWLQCIVNGQPGSLSPTQSDGSFEIQRDASAHEHLAQILLRSDDHHPEDLPVHEVPWGSRGVELRLPPAGLLRLVVLGAEDNPIQEYEAVLMPLLPGGAEAGRPRRSGAGVHAGGVVTLPGFKRGAWLLQVQFPEHTGLATWFARFFHSGGNGNRVVHAKPWVYRSVRVTDQSAEPLVSIPAQLYEIYEENPDPQDAANAAVLWQVSARNRRPLRIGEGVTDREGRMILRGIPGLAMELTLPGPGHVPRSIRGVRCDVLDELQVVVDRGANLRATVGPTGVMAELAERAGLGGDEPFPKHLRPRIDFVPSGGHAMTGMVTGDLAVPSAYWDNAGHFEAQGLPPGLWKMRLCYHIGRVNTRVQTMAVGEVTLQGGKTAVIEVDASALIPGRLEAQVMLNGRPLAQALVNLLASGAAMQFRTDAGGRFDAKIPAGDYQVSLMRDLGGSRFAVLAVEGALRIVRGELTRREIAVFCAPVQLKVCDPRGEPVPRLQLLLVDQADRRLPILTTNSLGEVVTELLVGKYRLLVLPRELASEDSRRELMRQAGRGEDALTAKYLEVATFELVAGLPEARTIRLPEAAGY
jgi:hypothetical protein